MAQPPDEDRWDEVISAIRGSCSWCKSVVYVCHLCELIVLQDEVESLRFGVDQTSSYQKPSASVSRLPTILIEHRLLVERLNPGRGLNSKSALLACVLAHEMGHRALFDRLRVNDGFRDFVDVPLRDRRAILRALDVERYSKLAGVNSDVIDAHWARSQESEEELVSRETSGNPAPDSAVEQDSDIATAAAVRIAGEWAASVLGCMVAKRVATNSHRVGSIRDQLFAQFPPLGSLNVRNIFDLPCNPKDFEADAQLLAIHDLTGTHRNPDIQSCSRKLKSAGLTWGAAVATIRRA